MLFDGTLQTWELVSLLSLVPWLFAGVTACIRSERWRQFFTTAVIGIGMIGMFVGVAAIIIGSVTYLPWSGFREFFLSALLMTAVIIAYFVAAIILIFISIFISAVVFPDDD